MTKFIVGFIAGIVVATIGFTGVARLLDNSVNKVKEIATEQVK